LLTNKATDIDPEYSIRIAIGGSASANRVEFEMPGVVLAIPSVNTEQVVSTEISFTAQGTADSAFNLTAANELSIAYHAAAVS
jgi:hypothetical protein